MEKTQKYKVEVTNQPDMTFAGAGNWLIAFGLAGLAALSGFETDNEKLERIASALESNSAGSTCTISEEFLEAANEAKANGQNVLSYTKEDGICGLAYIPE